jgi:hypothetical protein
MTMSSRSLRASFAALVLVVPLLVSGCGRKIGDECRDAYECNNEDNTRSCDLSQPNGYCTIEGCDELSCPKEARCVRFFPSAEFLNKKCDPTKSPNACDAQEVCVQLGGEGRCAPRSTEKRTCMLKCDNDGDCREEYSCQSTGVRNSLALTPNPGEQVKYCAPRP